MGVTGSEHVVEGEVFSLGYTECGSALFRGFDRHFPSSFQALPYLT